MTQLLPNIVCETRAHHLDYLGSQFGACGKTVGQWPACGMGV